MTSINRDRALWSQILLANMCQNFFFQLRQALFGYARNSQCREIFPVFVLGQITGAEIKARANPLNIRVT